MKLPAILMALTGTLLSGCGLFGGGLSCEEPARYGTSGSAPPVRVPDDMTVPDESQALQIPSGEPLEIPGEDEPNPCLEVPPDFFEEDADA